MMLHRPLGTMNRERKSSLIVKHQQKTMGKLLLHEIQNYPSNSSGCSETLSSIILAVQDDSSEVSRRALSSLKALAKVNPAALMIRASIFGPVRAPLSFQLAMGVENVRAAQNLTGLDARTNIRASCLQ